MPPKKAQAPAAAQPVPGMVLRSSRVIVNQQDHRKKGVAKSTTEASKAPKGPQKPRQLEEMTNEVHSRPQSRSKAKSGAAEKPKDPLRWSIANAVTSGTVIVPAGRLEKPREEAENYDSQVVLSAIRLAMSVVHKTPGMTREDAEKEILEKIRNIPKEPEPKQAPSSLRTLRSATRKAKEGDSAPAAKK